MAQTLLRPFTVALAVAVLATVGTRVPSVAQSDDPIDALERTSIALVYIDNTEFGVGFVVASNATSSYLLTAAHVLGCADTDAVGCRDTVKVRFVGQLSSVTGTKVLAKKDIKDGTDLALVKIDRGNLMPVPVLSRTVTDDEFYVIGFSQRIIESSDQFGGRPEVHDGNVSRINSPELQNFIEVSVPAYPGFSGGPIVDKETHAVVGVFSGHLRPEDQTQIDYQGVGPALILKFLADAEALTHVPFTQISSEVKSAAAAATPADPISQIAASEYVPPIAAPAATSAPSAPAATPSSASAAPVSAPAAAGAARPLPRQRVGPSPVFAPAPNVPSRVSERSDFATKLQAAKSADPVGEFLTALAYQGGIGVDPDGAAGIVWLQKAADAKYPPALTSLALDYERGSGVTADGTHALALFRSAADLGEFLAAFSCGRIYHYGKLGVMPDEAKSQSWYAKGVAAAQAASARGDAAASWTLANAYLNGIGVSADTAKGVALLELASNQGSAGATNNLALSYLQGRNVSRDTAKGFALLEKSARLGGPKSAFDLAQIYIRGSFGVTADPARGQQYLEQAAALGNAQAMWRLGLEALSGDHVPLDAAVAGTWFRKSAALGYLPGQTQYGRWLLETGPPASRVPARGLALLEDAADKGWNGAQYYLGNYYHDGRFVPRDDVKAFAFLKKAALDGNMGAQFDVGRSYELGLGVAANPDLAHFWYQLAANQGDVAAQRKLEVATK